MHLMLMVAKEKDVAVNHETNDMNQNNEVARHNHCLTQYLLKRKLSNRLIQNEYITEVL